MFRNLLFITLAVVVSLTTETAALADNSAAPVPMTLHERALKIQGIHESMHYLDHCLRPDLERQIASLDQLRMSYPSDQWIPSQLNCLKDELHWVYASLARDRWELAMYIREQEEAYKKLPPDTPDS